MSDFSDKDIQAAQRAAQQVLKTLNSPAFQAVLEAQRKDHARIAQMATEAASADMRRRIAAATSFQKAQARIAQQVAEASRVRYQVAAVSAISSWLDNERVNNAIRSLVDSAQAREVVGVDLDEDADTVAVLAEVEAPPAAAIDELDQALALEPETLQAVDDAASALMLSFPHLNRGHARWIVVLVAYIGSAAGLLGLSLVPVLAALPGLLGWTAPGAAEAAGKAFDRVLPPVDDRDASLEQGPDRETASIERKPDEDEDDDTA